MRKDPNISKEFMLVSVVKLQSLVRGFLGRVRAKQLKKLQKIKKKYFLEEEFWETLSSSRIFNP